MDAQNETHTLVARQREWIAAFDEAVETGDWSALGDHLTDDVRYIISGSPFAVSLSGRDAVLGGLRKSIENFDNRFDRRVWLPVGTRVRAPNTVDVRVWSHYEKEGLPPLSFPAFCSFTFRGDKIELMTDLYEDDLVELQEAFAWLGERPGQFDPSYK